MISPAISNANRLPLFAQRAAPVQATFPNYPGTTGVSEIDYIFTDIWTTPNGCDAEYAEQPWRLPSGYLVYREAQVPVTPLPALGNGYVTFGMFQRPGKLHAGAWDAVARVLRAEPSSRLLIHFSSVELDEERGPHKRRMLGLLEQRGVSADRVSFRGNRISPEHLALIGEADIALDSFPYNGQTTTCDCLWMGVPVVTLRGSTHVSRVSQGLLERVGLGRLAAADPDGYVDAAAGLARDLEGLAQLRGALRQTMRDRSLTDGRRLAAEIEDAYRGMWAGWCSDVRAA